MDRPTTVKSVRQLYAKWPGTLAKLIEDKANAPVNPEQGGARRPSAR
jgi:hypothetical protein